MSKNAIAGMAVLIAMPLIYLAAAALMLYAAWYSAWAVREVWLNGFFEPFTDWSHQSGRLFTRKTDLAFMAFLALVLLVFLYFLMVALALPCLAWRDYGRKIRGSASVPMKKLAWLSPMIDRAFTGTGAKPQFNEVRFDAGVDVSMGCKNTVFGGFFGKRAVAIGLTALFHVDEETLGHMLRRQALSLKSPFSERVRASLTGMCELFWRMASARDPRATDFFGEPDFPPFYFGRWLLLYPLVASFLLIWLRQAKDRLERERDRKQLEINLRKTRPSRARAVRALRGLAEGDSGTGVLPDDLPLFLLGGSRLERLHMGAFRADVWESVPEGSASSRMDNFEAVCKAATREIYGEWNLDGMRTISVDACVDHVNGLTRTDPLFAR